MLRPFADVRYDAYSIDPGRLNVDPVSRVPEQSALPALSEPAVLPPVTRPAPGHDEALVAVEDRRVRVLAPHWHEGRAGAMPGAWLRSGAAARLSSAAGPVRELRRLPVHTMGRAGFVVLDLEWWHFEYGTPRWAAHRGEAPRCGPAAPPDGGRH